MGHNLIQTIGTYRKEVALMLGNMIILNELEKMKSAFLENGSWYNII